MITEAIGVLGKSTILCAPGMRWTRKLTFSPFDKHCKHALYMGLWETKY